MKMNVNLTVEGLSKTEDCAKRILEHVKAINDLMYSMQMPGVSVELKSENGADEADTVPER